MHHRGLRLESRWQLLLLRRVILLHRDAPFETECFAVEIHRTKDLVLLRKRWKG